MRNGFIIATGLILGIPAIFSLLVLGGGLVAGRGARLDQAPCAWDSAQSAYVGRAVVQNIEPLVKVIEVRMWAKFDPEAAAMASDRSMRRQDASALVAAAVGPGERRDLVYAFASPDRGGYACHVVTEFSRQHRFRTPPTQEQIDALLIDSMNRQHLLPTQAADAKTD